MKPYNFLLLIPSLLMPLHAVTNGPELKNAIDAVRMGTARGEQSADRVVIALGDFIKADKFAPSAETPQNVDLSLKAVQLILIDPSQESKSVRLSAVEKFLEAISDKIEENYTEQKVVPNVSPPPGTPNAISGMNPDAIEDPVIKKQYLAEIKENQDKNLKNVQQAQLRFARERVAKFIANAINAGTEGLTKKEALDRFGKRKEIRELIELHSN